MFMAAMTAIKQGKCNEAAYGAVDKQSVGLMGPLECWWQLVATVKTC